MSLSTRFLSIWQKWQIPITEGLLPTLCSTCVAYSSSHLLFIYPKQRNADDAMDQYAILCLVQIICLSA